MFGFDGASATLRRSNAPGLPGSATAVQVTPPSLDVNSPSAQAARTSAAGPPTGAIEMAHVVAVRWEVHVTPPSVETYRPKLVAASRCWPLPRSTTRS